MRLSSVVAGFFAGAICFIATSVMLAWTGPTQTAPNGNVAAPINVGTVDQLKNGGLGVSSLAVFGNAILSGASPYLNFGSTAGKSGYGIRDNNGVMEFRDSGGEWTPFSTVAGRTGNNFTVSSDTQNVNLYVLAGSPASPGTYTITINPGVTVSSASTANAALTTGVWPAGSIVKLINNGNIYGRGGAGGGGSSGAWNSTAGAGGAGGPAMSIDYDVTVDNTNGNIFGGGGGGGGGGGTSNQVSYQIYTIGGGGGGGGQGAVASNGGAGGDGNYADGNAGGSGTASGAGSGGAAYMATYGWSYAGGSGGTWATAGSSGSYGGGGGAAGRAINVNGHTITWLGGNNANQVKGAVQ